MATMLSPPGRFSTTTGCLHSACNLSAKTRAPMSAPAPGPNGTINFTGRRGHAAARAHIGLAIASTQTRPDESRARRDLIIIFCPYSGHAHADDDNRLYRPRVKS